MPCDGFQNEWERLSDERFSMQTLPPLLISLVVCYLYIHRSWWRIRLLFTHPEMIDSNGKLCFSLGNENQKETGSSETFSTHHGWDKDEARRKRGKQEHGFAIFLAVSVHSSLISPSWTSFLSAFQRTTKTCVHFKPQHDNDDYHVCCVKFSLAIMLSFRSCCSFECFPTFSHINKQAFSPITGILIMRGWLMKTPIKIDHKNSENCWVNWIFFSLMIMIA